MIDCFSVQNRPGARGVIAHHAANRRAVCCRDIGRKPQSEGLQLGIQLRQDHARFDARPPVFLVYFENAIQILGRVNLQTLANRLPGLRCAAAAYCEWAPQSVAGPDNFDNIVARFRNDNAERFNLINTGIG